MALLDLIFAARPLLHLPVWSIFLVSLHYHHELSGKSWSFTDFGIVAMLSLLASSAYYINQLYDFESDKLNGKVAFLERGYVTKNGLVVATIATAVVGLAGSICFGATIVAIALQLLLLALMYSVPPVRLKDRPLAGLFANAYGYGFLIPFSVMPEINVDNAGLLGWDNPFYFFCAVGAVYVMTTLSDIRGDAATGKCTVAVVFGRTRCYLLAVMLLGGGCWFGWSSEHFLLAAIAGISLGTTVIAIFARSERFDLFATKLPILLLTILAGWWYPFYLLFMVALIAGTRLYYKRRFGMIYPRLA
ncbi:MAG: UbiA family prenyltransferase [Candidatus Zixiibacteriota bacterium]